MTIVVDDAAVRRVARHIEAYLLRHPQAADTVEGVGQWWLSGREEYSTVEGALEWLVHQGVSQRHVQPDGVVVYSAGRRRVPRK